MAGTPGLEVVDLTTGSLTVGEQVFDKDTNFRAKTSPSITGNHLFVPTGDGTVTILEPGPKPRVVATNILEQIGGNLFFQGARIYVRTLRRLVCLGVQQQYLSPELSGRGRK
jgi:hypothetical protein